MEARKKSVSLAVGMPGSQGIFFFLISVMGFSIFFIALGNLKKSIYGFCVSFSGLLESANKNLNCQGTS